MSPFLARSTSLLWSETIFLSLLASCTYYNSRSGKVPKNKYYVRREDFLEMTKAKVASTPARLAAPTTEYRTR